MPSFFSRLKGKDGPSKVSKKKGAQDSANKAPAKQQWEDAYARPSVEPEEVQELIRGCTAELKSRGLDTPFLLLPFRPTSDPSAARTFIRHYFDRRLHGELLSQELRLTEPMVLCSVIKWCWSRIAGGVVSWEAYELFRVGETDSNMARDAFRTFIPISVESETRTRIIFDFFDLLAAVAAHGKTNGLGGRKLSRMAGWWAFEHTDGGNGFEGGYRSWLAAADAASHLFFAYLRSLSPEQGVNGINTLPMSLQKLLQETEYPPERPALLQSTTTRVVMIVDSVSPTPFSLLRRANHFQYRDDDRALQQFAEYEDPIKALTDECRRVLKSIASANQSQVSTSKDSTGLREASWSRFEDIGFSGTFDEADDEDDESSFAAKKRSPQGPRTTPRARNVAGGRPTTPSWADFLSSGFVDEAKNGPAPLLLPPDKILPPIDTRGQSSQSHKANHEAQNLEPGELASITRFDLDDSFWWVWITSLAGEETPNRKATFGRCALIETIIRGGRWLVMEEMVKGAAPAPEEGAYIAEKKGFWGRTKKNKVSRRKSTGKHALDQNPGLRPGFKTNQAQSQGVSKTSIGPDQHARIQAAAMQLQQRQRQQEADQQAGRRGRNEVDAASMKTSSVFTLQPVIMNEASPAMKWANKYDKDAIREAYLASNTTGTGRGIGEATMRSAGFSQPSQETLRAPNAAWDRDLPAVPSPGLTPTATTPIVETPPPAPFPPTPDIREPDQDDVLLSEKAADVSLPGDVHPVNRKPLGSPEPPPTERTIKPNADTRPSQEVRPSVESSGHSPESKKQHNKLKKKEAGGFRKIFGRKNRQSKIPDGAAEELKENNLQPGGATLGRRFSGFQQGPAPSPTAVIGDNDHSTSPAPPVSDAEATPVPSPQPDFDRSYDPSVRDSISRVDTNDEREANHAFSNFDQGPLEGVPTFVPEGSPRISEDSAAPPPIKWTRGTPEDGGSLTKQDSGQVQDRWAQIRKEAAERAAAQRQSDEAQSRGGHSQRTEGDDETSGEETIESRVARIKARVAELTGNMDGSGAPAPTVRR